MTDGVLRVLVFKATTCDIKLRLKQRGTVHKPDINPTFGSEIGKTRFSNKFIVCNLVFIGESFMLGMVWVRKLAILFF